MTAITHTFGVYAVDTATLFNAQPGESDDYVLAPDVCDTITLTVGDLTTLSVEDNVGDKFLSGDDTLNETADDQHFQTTSGEHVYVDYELCVKDEDGNNYTLYVIDVGESSPTDASINEATSYLTFDPANPPPEGVELTVVSWHQTPHLPYKTFEVPCFAEGTRLRLADGRSKPVEDIVAGDVLMTAKTGQAPVIWVGASIEEEPVYEIMNERAARMTVTKNHGVAVKLLDGTFALAPAKFLGEAQYADFAVREITGEKTKVYHIMLDVHDLVYSYDGLVSESYFCGGYQTIPAAQRAFFEHTGHSEMALTLPRVKRKDAAEIAELKTGRALESA